MPVSTRYFEVTTPEGLSTLKLDSKGRTTCQITVKNVSQAPIDGRLVLVSVPVTRPRRGAVENQWVTIEGSNERHFNVDEEGVFSVRVAVPQQQDNPPAPGNYAFRAEVINIADTDLSGDQSPTLGFTVARTAPPKRSMSMPPWIPLAAGVVLIIGNRMKPLLAIAAGILLIIGGAVAWLVMRGKTAARS